MTNKKELLNYCRISVSDGLCIELKTSELCLERYNKDVYKRCGQCHQVIEIKKNLKKTQIHAICVLTFYKIKTELIQLCTISGNKTQNIEFA